MYDAEKLLGMFERAIKNNIDKASGKEYNNETRYAVLPRPNDGVEWARGLLTDAEITQFYSNIADLKKLKFKFRKAGDGSYIFETDNSFILTDGNWTKPTIKYVISFDKSKGYNTSYLKGKFYEEFKTIGYDSAGQLLQTACDIFGYAYEDGVVSFGSFENSKEIHGRQGGRGKGTDSR